MVTIESFKNQKGQNITYIAIDAFKSNGVKYKVKIGFKKAGIILAHKEEIELILKEKAEQIAPEAIGIK